MLYKTLLSVILLQLVVLDTTVGDKICPKLREIFNRGETSTVMVSFSKDLSEPIKKAKESPAARSHKISKIITELKKTTQESQQDVMNMLSAQRRSLNTDAPQYTSYWLSNSILIENATKEEVEKIAQDSQVSKIYIPRAMPIPSNPMNDPKVRSVFGRSQKEGTEGGGLLGGLYPDLNFTWPPEQFWALPQIQAEDAWAELDGSKGEGIIVANIDTGVHLPHVTLKNNFRGEYGWYDPETKAPDPFDDHGHGTNTMSMLAGGTLSDGTTYLGVAPGANWMACKGCDVESCPPKLTMPCLQWMACPTLPDGSGEDCSKAPHVLNLSWGGSNLPADVVKAVNNVVEMGIIVVAAISNSGPKCKTTDRPGDMENVIGVGANDYKNQVAFFSGRGPTADNRIKPDLVAPGQVVWVAYNETEGENGTDAVKWDAGSSLASPLVAGVVALLKVRNPDLTWQEAKKLLIENVDGGVTTDDFYEEIVGQKCGDTGVETVPNNLYGWGRLNAFKTVKAQTALLAE